MPGMVGGGKGQCLEREHLSCAARCRHRNLDGAHRVRIRRAKTVVASPHCDVQLDYCLLVNPWRGEPDSSRGHVARHHQRFGVWCRVSLVFLL